MRRVPRLIAIVAVAIVALFASHAGAEEVPVPAGLQAELLAKVAAYDRNLPARAGDRVRVALVVKRGNADSERVVAQMQAALAQIGTIGALPHDDAIVAWAGAPALTQSIKSQRTSIAFFAPGFADDLDAIRAALDGVDVLSASAVPDYVSRGIVLGFDLVSGKPKLLVNITQARKQNVAFKAEVLKMMKVYE